MAKKEPAPRSIPGIEVRTINSMRGVFATQILKAGKVIGYFYGNQVPSPTQHSITDAENNFIDPNGQLGMLNHACNEKANAYLGGKDGRVLIAKREIQPDEQLTIDYNITEMSISVPFPCDCGDDNCCKLVEGSDKSKGMGGRG